MMPTITEKIRIKVSTTIVELISSLRLGHVTFFISETTLRKYFLIPEPFFSLATGFLETSFFFAISSHPYPVLTEITLFLCGEYGSCRIYSIFSFQVCQDHSFCFSCYYNYAACNQYKPG